MPNPLWTQKTWRSGGGDGVRAPRRFYRYHFEDQWFRFITPYKAEISLPFETSETMIWGDMIGHQLVLDNPDFQIGGRDVMPWARECVTQGKADFLFDLNGGDLLELPRPPVKLTLRASFSNPALATMFKLTFG